MATRPSRRARRGRCSGLWQSSSRRPSGSSASGPRSAMFGSARVQPGHPYYKLAEDTARLLSDAGFAVISGGGPGIMEAANKGAFEGSGLAVGLNIELPREQPSQPLSGHQPALPAFLRAQGDVREASRPPIVVLPGGFGTLDELFEALTLVQTGKTRQMPIILVHEPFWRGLLDWFRERLVGRRHDRRPTTRSDPGDRRAAGSGRRDLRVLREARLRAFARRARGAAQPLVESPQCGALRCSCCWRSLRARAAAQSRPPKLEPLPEPPPPPPMPEGRTSPAVRIPVQRQDKVEEMRRERPGRRAQGDAARRQAVLPGRHPGNGNWMRRDSLGRRARADVAASTIRLTCRSTRPSPRPSWPPG